MARRAWWQIHLSTAVVMMLATGAYVWENLRTRVYRAEYDWKIFSDEIGWPWIIRSGSGWEFEETEHHWIPFNIVANVLVLLAGLLFIILLAERWCAEPPLANASAERRYFRLRAATWLALASVILLLSTLSLSHPRRYELSGVSINNGNVTRVYEYGWPEICFKHEQYTGQHIESKVELVGLADTGKTIYEYYDWTEQASTHDCFIAAGLLIVTLYVAEGFARRRRPSASPAAN